MIHTPKTSYLELDHVLTDHAIKLQDALGNNFVGFYLQGSLAIGDFDLSSDVDFIVVTHEELTPEQVQKVQEIHTHIYNENNRWVKRLEYSYFPKLMLNTRSSPYVDNKRIHQEKRDLWYFDNEISTIVKSDHCNTLVTRWIVREKGVSLLGPDPTTLIDPIPADSLRKEIKDTLIGWGEELLHNPERYRNRFYQSYLVLNYARMLHDLHEGKIGSKLAGITWAKVNLDPQWKELINYCWEERQDVTISVKQPAISEVFEKSLQFVSYVVEQGKKYVIS